MYAKNTVEPPPGSSSPEPPLFELDSEQETNASPDNAEVTTIQSTNKGPNVNDRTIFGFLGLIICIFAVFIAIVHFTVYLLGYGWQRNPTSLALGLQEKFEEGQAPNRVIDSHALLGITSVIFMAFQVLSGLRMGLASSDAPPRWAAKLHRWNGRPVATMWLVTAVLGFVFLHVSDRHKEYSDTLSTAANAFKYFIFYSVGIGTIANLLVGVSAVLVSKSRRDMVLHKGSMFFSLYWILGSALDELLIVVVQLCFPHCNLGGEGVLMVATVGECMQLALILTVGYHFAGDSFSRPFVRLNLAALGFRTTFMVLASAYNLANPPQDETCLGRLN